MQVMEEDESWYKVEGMDNVLELHWVVEGGKIEKRDGKDCVKVKFYDDAPCHSVTACGKYVNGVEFREKIEK